MRILIVSDIHANLAALDSVLRDAEAGGVIDAVWCLGDTVGYGPQPGECIERLTAVGAVWVAGNHERAATGAMSTEYFNPDAAQAALWTRSRLTPDEQRLLDALPEVITESGFTLVHGTLRDPVWEYLYTEEIALAHLDLQETAFGLVGHTHVPLSAYLPAGQAGHRPDRPQRCELHRLRAGEAVRLPERGKIVLNPGSVGQPRDGDPRAAYAVYDTEAGELRFQRADYGIQATQKLMEEAGLPRRLIERLSVGR